MAATAKMPPQAGAKSVAAAMAAPFVEEEVASSSAVAEAAVPSVAVPEEAAASSVAVEAAAVVARSAAESLSDFVAAAAVVEEAPVEVALAAFLRIDPLLSRYSELALSTSLV